MGLFTVEAFNPPAPDGAAYSCRLLLGDEPFFSCGFSVNGKGMTPRWALASAYGEMMERLACGELLPGLFQARASRGGTFLTPEAFAAACPEAFARATGCQSRAALAAFLRDAYGDVLPPCQPYRTLEGETALFPEETLRDLCGTTGLCAGNTPEEAMLQGLMEIFERYATRKLFQFGLTPPEIPAALFEGTDVLKRLRALGMPFSIRDVSLGKGFPVIALVLTRPDGACSVHLGAAVSPVTALERCLTETFQGSPAAVARRFRAPGALASGDARALYEAYHEAVAIGGGAWPDSVCTGSASWPFAGFDRREFASDAEALRHFVAVAERWGGRLFFRDCSLEGFPAFRLYIPGASEAFLNFTLSREDFTRWMRLRRHRATVMRLPRADGAELNALANAVLDAREALMPVSREPLAWLSDGGTPGAQAPEGLFFPLLFGAAGMYALAAKEMDAFLETPASQHTPRLYLRALSLFWDALSRGAPPETAGRAVADQFGEALGARCLSALQAPQALFSPREWPVCPDCAICALKPKCPAEALRHVIKRL